MVILQRRRWLSARSPSSARGRACAARRVAVRRAARGGRRAAGGARVAAGGGGRAGRARDAGGGRRRAGAGGRGARRRGQGAHPLVAAHASWLLAQLLDQRGETREAERLRASLGLLSHCLRHRAVRRGTRQPEHAVSAGEGAGPAGARARTTPGKTHEVGWRAADAAVRDGVLLPGRPAASRRSGGRLRRDVRAQRPRSAGRAAPRLARADQGLGQRRRRLHARRRPPRGAGPGRGRHPARPRLEPDPDQDRDHRRRLAPLRARHGRRRARRSRLDEQRRARRRPTRWRGAGRSRRRGSTRWRRCSNGGRGGSGGRADRPGPIWRACSPGRRRAIATTGPRRRRSRAAFELLSPPGPTPRPEPALRLAAADATDDDDERRRMLEQALDARPPPQWRALLLARLGVAARAARREAEGAGGVARSAGDRSRVLGGVARRSPRRRRTPGCP